MKNEGKMWPTKRVQTLLWSLHEDAVDEHSVVHFGPLGERELKVQPDHHGDEHAVHPLVEQWFLYVLHRKHAKLNEPNQIKIKI